MQLHIALQMTVMLADANLATDQGKPHKIRSFLHSLAARNLTIPPAFRVRQGGA